MAKPITFHFMLCLFRLFCMQCFLPFQKLSIESENIKSNADKCNYSYEKLQNGNVMLTSPGGYKFQVRENKKLGGIKFLNHGILYFKVSFIIFLYLFFRKLLVLVPSKNILNSISFSFVICHVYFPKKCIYCSLYISPT